MSRSRGHRSGRGAGVDDCRLAAEDVHPLLRAQPRAAVAIEHPHVRLKWAIAQRSARLDGNLKFEGIALRNGPGVGMRPIRRRNGVGARIVRGRRQRLRAVRGRRYLHAIYKAVDMTARVDRQRRACRQGEVKASPHAAARITQSRNDDVNVVRCVWRRLPGIRIGQEADVGAYTVFLIRKTLDNAGAVRNGGVLGQSIVPGKGVECRGCSGGRRVGNAQWQRGLHANRQRQGDDQRDQQQRTKVVCHSLSS